MLQTQAIRHAPARALLPGILVREALAPGTFVALILASNYALASMPNVKLFDLLVFVAGYTLGLRRGITVAVAAWLVYGQISPWGVAQPQLLATLMVSEALFAGAGVAAQEIRERRPHHSASDAHDTGVPAAGAHRDACL